MKTNEVSIYDFYNIYQTTHNYRIIDVRETYDFDENHIPGAINIPLGLIKDKHFLFINMKNHYYMICKNGSLSTIAVKFLTNLGYNVTNICGGLERWEGKIIKTKKTLVSAN